MATNIEILMHPLPFFHHVSSARVFYVAEKPCPLVFSISLEDVARHAPVVGGDDVQATHPFGKATTVASLAEDKIRRALGETLRFAPGAFEETMSRWATFCDDVAQRLGEGESLPDALDDTWVLSNERDVVLDDEPANSPQHELAVLR